MRPDHPQRLTAPAAPGALLKRTPDFGKRMRLRLIEPERDEAYLAMIRQLPCLKCAMEPPGIEAAHVRMASGAHGKVSGIGKKPHDRWAVPLCGDGSRGCHAQQHALGEREFWSVAGINPLLVCEGLYAARGDVVAMRMVILAAITERGR